MNPSLSIVSTFVLPTATKTEIEYRWTYDRRVEVWMIDYELDQPQDGRGKRISNGTLIEVLEIACHDDIETTIMEITDTIIAHFDFIFAPLFTKKGNE